MAFKVLILAMGLIGTAFGAALSSVNVKDNFLTFAGQLPGDYDIAQPKFVGTIFGEKFEINGTISEVIAELEHIHAGKNLSVLDALSVNNDTTDLEEDFILDKRDGPLCIPVAGQPWLMANPHGIDAAVGEINKLGLGIILPPRHCSRVSCRGNAGIWVCVDAPHEIYLRGTAIAGFARHLQERCSRRLSSPPYWTLAGGQLFDWRGFNTILRDDRC